MYKKLRSNIIKVHQNLSPIFNYFGHQINPIYKINSNGRTSISNPPLQSDLKDYYRIEGGIFVCFDWVAADFVMLGHLSNDQFIKDAFKSGSDPYLATADLLNSNREEIKINLISAIYGDNLENDKNFIFMEQLYLWKQKLRDDYQKDYPGHTYLGRPIVPASCKSFKNYLDQIVKGSVAEAIQME